MDKKYELIQLSGAEAGRRSVIPETGLRIGRASSNDLSIADEELSRNHCIIEYKAGTLQILDLASANGTYVNSESIGNSPYTLHGGDVIEIGVTRLRVIVPSEGGNGAAIDLGLEKTPPSATNAVGSPTKKLRTRRFVLIILGLLVLIAAGVLFWLPVDQPSAPNTSATNEMPLAAKKDGLFALYCENIEANNTFIFRYQMTIGPDAVLRVVSDNVPGENRHVDKSVRLTPEVIARVDAIFKTAGWDDLDSVYSGMSATDANELKSSRVRVVRAGKVKDVLVENTPEPPAFTAVREALETFARNELGIWAIQYSREKLVELSLASEETGDTKWADRGVEFGNLSAAIKAYKESLFYLETVDPKPQHFASVKKKLEVAESELDERYREQRFLANKAINLADWAEAQKQLRILCNLIPDKDDPRHKEANAKLVEIDGRLRAAKKGGSK